MQGHSFFFIFLRKTLDKYSFIWYNMSRKRVMTNIKRRKKMKVGECKELTNNKLIKKIWLTKWMPTKEYQVWGLRTDENQNATGWCVLFGGTLGQARNYAKRYN